MVQLFSWIIDTAACWHFYVLHEYSLYYQDSQVFVGYVLFSGGVSLELLWLGMQQALTPLIASNGLSMVNQSTGLLSKRFARLPSGVHCKKYLALEHVIEQSLY